VRKWNNYLSDRRKYSTLQKGFFPYIKLLYTTHFLVKSKSKFSAFLQQLWGFVLVFGQHRRQLENSAFQLKQPSSRAASKNKQSRLFYSVLLLCFLSTCWQFRNGLCITKKLSRLLAQAGTQTHGRLRYYRPCVCAPYLKVR